MDNIWLSAVVVSEAKITTLIAKRIQRTFDELDSGRKMAEGDNYDDEVSNFYCHLFLMMLLVCFGDFNDNCQYFLTKHRKNFGKCVFKKKV